MTPGREPFGLAILDMQMPEMDGLTLALETRTLRPSVPLIMLTSVGRREVGVPGDLFAAYLNKPIEASRLHGAALTVLARCAAMHVV